MNIKIKELLPSNIKVDDIESIYVDFQLDFTGMKAKLKPFISSSILKDSYEITFSNSYILNIIHSAFNKNKGYCLLSFYTTINTIDGTTLTYDYPYFKGIGRYDNTFKFEN